MPTLQIDGDVVVYRCGFAVEKTQYLVTDASYTVLRGFAAAAKDAKSDLVEYDTDVLWSRKEVEPESHALALVKSVIGDIRDRYPNHEPYIWLSPSVGNFRERIATRAKYKGNRDSQHRPVHFNAIRDYLCSKYGARTTAGQEADDAIGIGMHDAPGSVCVSIDKDLKQIAGTHYNWVDKTESTISPRQAALNFYTQILAGDATDNVPGIEGIGPRKAAAILDKVSGAKEAWQRCLGAYGDVYGKDGEAFALETARLVYVRRKPDEIWSPPLL
jgi:hypothetical protein